MVLALPPLWQWKITEGLWRTDFFSLLAKCLIHNSKGFQSLFIKTQVFLKQKKTRSLYSMYVAWSWEPHYRAYTNTQQPPSRPADLLKSVGGQIFHFVLIIVPWISECIFHCNHKQKIFKKKAIFYFHILMHYKLSSHQGFLGNRDNTTENKIIHSF